MKLIYCTRCAQIVSLCHQETKCRCGLSGGFYKNDNQTVVLYGPCIPLGITNESFMKALKNRPGRGPGAEFVAFIIPRRCITVKRIEEEDEEAVG